MGKLVPFPAADFVAAKKRIIELWESGTVVVLPHALERMAQRRLDMLDLQHIIRYGKVTSLRGTRHTVQGTTVEERPAKCIVQIGEDLIVITMCRTRKKK